MKQMTVPSSVSQNVARAKSLIQRKEPLRALDCLILALQNFHPGGLIGKARFEVEVNIQQCVVEINLNPKVRELLTTLSHSPNPSIPYAPGGEAALLSVLSVLRKALVNIEESEKIDAENAVRQRKAGLIENAQNLLDRGEGIKGKIELRKLAAEFGEESGVLAQIGTMLVKAGMPADSVEFLELAIENFPKDAPAYSILVESYMGMRELEKAEAVYLKALKQFGGHPRTYVSLAKIYKTLNKRQKAVDMAQKALSMDPDNAEAREIVASIRV